MTNKELLIPRIMVNIPYPNSPFKVGDIRTCADNQHGDINYYRQFPHIFKELKWWEERKVEDMPQYVKGIDMFEELNYANVKWRKNKDGDMECSNLRFENEQYFLLPSMIDFMPCEKEEYLSFIERLAK